MTDLPSSRLWSEAMISVFLERERQKEFEGWTPEHDDTHDRFELAALAARYVEHASRPDKTRRERERRGPTPLHASADAWFKPKDRRRDLVRAGALILAEIERLDRAAAKVPA